MKRLIMVSGLAVALVVGACGQAATPKEEASGSAGTEGAIGIGAAGTGGSVSTSTCPLPGATSAAQDSVAYLPGVTVTTVAGGAQAGNLDGPAEGALFNNPVSVLVDRDGTLVVCDFDNDMLRRIDLSSETAVVSTVTRQSDFARPFGLALGVDGTIYVDTDYNPAGEKSGKTGTVWHVDAATGLARVVGTELGRPRGLAMRSDAHLVLGDYQNARVRVLNPVDQVVNDLVAPGVCAVGSEGEKSEPPFAMPYGVGVLPNGGLVVADAENHQLRAVSPTGGMVAGFAGGWEPGTIDGPARQARFSRPTALAVDAAGDVFVSDVVAHRIRRISADGVVTTVAGNGTAGFRDGAGAEAQFFGQEGLAVTPDGRTLYVADGTGGEEGPYHRVRRIDIAP